MRLMANLAAVEVCESVSRPYNKQAIKVLSLELETLAQKLEIARTDA